MPLDKVLTTRCRQFLADIWPTERPATAASLSALYRKIVENEKSARRDAGGSASASRTNGA